jgi:hypothetical protein
MKLSGKSREEIAAALAGADRDRLIDLIYELSIFERLMTSGEIARHSRIDVREVIADMRAGRFVDPIHGRGFFSRARNSLKVSVSAANRWRREWFVPRELRSIPAKKNGARSSEIGLVGENAGQKGAAWRPTDFAADPIRFRAARAGQKGAAWRPTDNRGARVGPKT